MRSIRPAAWMVAAMLSLVAVSVSGGEIGTARLDIVGLSLEVVPEVVTGIDIPASAQTTFGGKTEEAVPPTDLTVAADLIGPGIDTPLPLVTAPGHKFAIPPLHQQGDYLLQNVRLLDRDGRLLQVAVPSSVAIHVTGVLDTKITVRQLTPDDLRARGISIDARNYDAYDYSMVFAINGQSVTIPYPVIVDKRTHQVISIPSPPDDHLPLPGANGPPPRFQPPAVIPFVMQESLGGGGAAPPPSAGDGIGQARGAITVPAALVIPNGFGVLHQFFGVMLNVGNNAPAGAAITLDAITATISPPAGLRVVKVNPAVSMGQPVPIRDRQTGAQFLAAQAQGSSDWSVEALRTGTHTVDVEIRATYRQPGQADVALQGHVRSTIVVSDPRFQINFVHPDTVRANETYTAYAFITNTSASQQTVKLDGSSIPSCAYGFSNNVCRVEGDAIRDLTFDAGQTIAVPSKLKTSQTGQIYAAAANAPDGITASLTLAMGVSTSGIPLSPATLVLPWYAQYLNPALVEGQMGLLGLGYSLAVAPMTPKIAALPRVIRADVDAQAQAMARAGQRIFVSRKNPAIDDPAEDREAIEALALDLLGNQERVDQLSAANDLQELDALRRQEQQGRDSAAAIARELERVGLAGGKSASQFVSEFAASTTHRSPFLLALVHGAPVASVAEPYAMTVTDASTHATMSGVAERTGWRRTLLNGELSQFTGSGEAGALALVGRWRNALDISIAASSSSFQLELVYPDTQDGSFLTATMPVSGATVGTPVTVRIARGSRTLLVSGASASPLVTAVPQRSLELIAAAQDLHLDPAAHTVSLLLNRPVRVGDPSVLRNLVSLTTRVDAASYSVTRKNNPADPNAPLVIPGAALQADGRVMNLSFDHALSRNAQYAIGLDPITDRLNGGMSFSAPAIVPRIDNDAPGGIVSGRLLRGDGTPAANALVQLTSGTPQFDATLADGAFLFEFVPRDPDRGLHGGYNLRAAANGKTAVLDGSVRVAGEVQRVVLQFLGRGSATGRIMYSDGTPVASGEVTIASTMYSEFHRTRTATDGSYAAGDLPVGPLTIAVSDAHGNLTYAATRIRAAGESIVQNLVIQKRLLAGLATVRLLVKRSDAVDALDPTKGVVAGAHVGVSTQGYGLLDGITGNDGRFEFRNVPAGFVSLLASEFSISRQSAGVDLDLRPDTIVEQTLILEVPTPAAATQLVTLSGTVLRDEPAAPSDRTRDVPVRGAVVTVQGMAPVFADAAGRYTCPAVPRSLSDRKAITVFDPATGRGGSFSLPTFVAGLSEFNLPLLLSTASPQGKATLRVRLSAATGEAVSTYRLIWPGFPAHEFEAKGGGIYELAVNVPQSVDVWAVPAGRDARYGDQMARGSMHADFDGQLSVLDLRLPGQGSITARILTRKPCSQGVTTCPEEYDSAQGTIAASYRVWSDSEQDRTLRQRPPVATDPVTGIASIASLPAGETVLIETVAHPSGYASLVQPIAFEGDVRSVDLKLASAGDVTGRVMAYDGQTPVAGATVELTSSVASLGTVISAIDGSFRMPSVAAGQKVRAVASVTRNGIFRQGSAEASTPAAGGPTSGLTIVLQQQASLGGTIVDAAGAPVPLARYWAMGLSWPFQKFGSAADPLIADQSGGFQLNNVFAGPVRVSATSPIRQEERGDWQGTIGFENDDHLGQRIVIGSAGTGAISVTVVDSDTAYARVPNAEVTLLRAGAAFDFGTSDANGVAYFASVPTGDSYSLRATSKKVGRSGSSASFSVKAGVPLQQQLILSLLGSVSGTVIDGDLPGTPPVRGSPVFLSAAAMSAAASTGSAGEFRFQGVPEGAFSLEALDVETGRRARSPATLAISKTIQQIGDLRLQFDRTATLAVRVYLPDDSGRSNGVLVPLAGIKVTQSGYSREAQAAASEVSFARMFANGEFQIEAKELGGAQRIVRASGTFPQGTFASSVALVLPASGNVRVQVTAADPSLIAGARLSLSAAGTSVTLFLDSGGVAEIGGLPLGPVSVQVTSGVLSASASGMLVSHSLPLVLSLRLGGLATVDGFVDAEGGGPSAGTRVLLDVSSPSVGSGLHLDTRTDTTGHYRFQGVPNNNSRVSVTMIGPDEVTIGAVIPETAIAEGAAQATMPRQRLDATPPEVTAIDPSNNANSVAPGAQVVVSFSEPLLASSITSGSVQLIAGDTNGIVACTIGTETLNGQFRVRLTPAAPLRSNVLHRVVIGSGLTDLSGHHLRAPVSASFTTVNYSEPRIIRVEPAVDVPLGDGATFRLKFNKSIDLASFAPGGGAVARVELLDAYHGAAISTLSIAAPYLDPADASALMIAPAGVRIQASSFYRVTVSGVRDTQQPFNVQKETQSFDYFSFDRIRPVVAIISPVPTGGAIVSDIAYTATAAITDEGTNAPSKDVQYVDWLLSDGVHPDQMVSRAFAAPWGYSFAAPHVETSGTRFTLKASATDLSFNTSDVAAMTWEVAPNLPPRNVTLTANPASVYLGAHIDAVAGFDDEGTICNVTLDILGKHRDGTDYHLTSASVRPALTQQVSRKSTADPWPRAAFGIDLPPDLLEGAPLHASVVVKDSDGRLSDPGRAEIALLTDTIAPRIVSVSPASETVFQAGDSFPISVVVAEEETRVAQVLLTFDNQNVSLTTGAYDPLSRTWTFTTTARATAKVADTRVRILATALDLHGNKASAATEVIYKSVNDGSIPVAQWLTPLDGAALPAGQAVTVTLRVRATDDRGIVSVGFSSPAFAVQPDAVTTANAGNDTFERVVTFTPPAGPFVITATVQDADPSHTQTLPIAIDGVGAGGGIVNITGDAAITSANKGSYENKTLVVSGASTHLYVDPPLSLQNLIVLGGASLGNPDRVRLDLTVRDHLFLEGGATIDLTGKGYAGGWKVSENGAIRNDSAIGVTAGGTTTGGASGGASGSYGGVGADGSGLTNAAYGSIAQPADFGSGGSGNASGTSEGGRGGGVVSLQSSGLDSDLGRFVIAGAVRADGESGLAPRAGAGSGGSVSISARSIVTSAATRITANGGDDDATDNAARGGGGGRIALVASERLDLPDELLELQSRGGRNGTVVGATYLDGGAGTIFLRKPGALSGSLQVSNLDESFPASRHLARFTPLSSAQGSLTFERLVAGPRALLRFDSEYRLSGATSRVVDPTAVILGPADLPSITTVSSVAAGANVVQNSSIPIQVTARSAAGAGEIHLNLDVTPQPSVSLPSYPLTLTALQVPLTLAPDARTGAASVSASVTDRAGRSATTPPMAWNVVANAPPAITRFDVTPLSTFAGRTISVDAAASDDLGVTGLTLASSIGSLTASSAVVSGGSTSRAFTVSTAKDTPGGTTIQLTLRADDNYVTHTVTQQKSVTILVDANPPSLSVTSPTSADAPYDVSSTVTIPVRAIAIDAEVGVASVWASIDGGPRVLLQPDPLVTNGWKANVPVPAVDGSDIVTKSLVVSAADYEGHVAASSPITLRIRPVYDPLGPAVTWLCPSAGALFPSSYTAKVRVSAVPSSVDNDVTAVNVFVAGASTPVAASRVAGTNVWQTAVALPAGSEGAAIPLRAVATSFRGNTTQVQTTVGLVSGDVIDADRILGASDRSLDDTHTLIVTAHPDGSATHLTIDGHHNLQRLIILNGATVQHSATTATVAGSLDLSVTGATYISCDGSIDVSGRGYSGTASSVARTWPNTFVGGSQANAGGSHGGRGGFADTNASAATFGSLFDPKEPGGAGAGSYYNANCDCYPGGGIVRIAGSAITVDGAIRANGSDTTGSVNGSHSSYGGGGAGGSIRLDASTIAGRGVIRADGGISGDASGGGGRVAIYGQSLALPAANITASGGAFANGVNAPRTGAPGTVYLKLTGRPFGDLVVDNGGLATSNRTSLSIVGMNVATAASPATITAAGAHFPAPDVLSGIRVILNGDLSPSWPIVSNDPTSLTITPGAAFNAAAGTAFRGLDQFDSLKLRNANLECQDVVLVGSAVDRDAVSTAIFGNAGPPVINRARISLTTSAVGSTIAGTNGAVSDPDVPVVLTATNTRTGVKSTAVADRLNGSFAIPVSGNAGDTFTFNATDSHPYPLTSTTADFGPLATDASPVLQIPKSGWNVDAAFLPRTVALDGRTLAVASYPTTNGASDRLVLFDLSDPAHPQMTRSLSANQGAIADVAIADGVVYTVAFRLAALSLSDPNAQPVFPSFDPGGRERAVAIAGGYAFTAEAGASSSGVIHVYDVTTPLAPRYLRSQAMASGLVHDFTDLQPYGSDYLVGISNSPSGRDVMVVDRRDVNNLKKVSDLAIPNFEAFRGTIAGSRLYLASLSTAEIVVVDLQNPAAPVVAGRLPLPAPAGNALPIEKDVLVAGGSAGLVQSPSDPTALALIGTAPLGGIAFDLAVRQGYAYVANESGLAVVPVTVAPRIDHARIRIVPSSATMVNVLGVADAITGLRPIRLELKSMRGGSPSASVTISLADTSDGSFNVSLPAAAGDSILITATDPGQRTAGPQLAGTVPFGTSAAVTPLSIPSDGFRARTLAIDGTALVVAGYSDGTNAGASDQVFLFDVTGDSPRLVRSLVANQGAVRDVAIAGGVAYSVASRLAALDLSDPAATPKYPSYDPGGTEQAVTVSDGYAFTAEGGASQSGVIHIYDVTIPLAPRYLRSQSMMSGVTHDFTDLQPLGNDYLIGISNSSSGRDVVIIDRRDANNLVKAGELSIPEIAAFRGRVVGTTLYLAGETGAAIVDCSTPASPRVLWTGVTPGPARGVAVSGNTMVIASAGDGVAFFDTSTGATTRLIGAQQSGGVAWDAGFGGRNLYVANDQGLVVVENVGAPPRIDPSKFTVAFDGAGSAIVTGSAGAVTGQSGVTATIRINSSGASSTVAVNPAVTPILRVTLPATPGDRVFAGATDSFGITAPVLVGQVPFGANAVVTPLSIPNDNFRARTLAVEGARLVMASYDDGLTGGASDKLAVFDVSSSPVLLRTLTANQGPIRDVTIAGGTAYTVASRLAAIDLADPNASPIYANFDPAASEQAVVVAGGYAFTAEVGGGQNGTIHVYDVTSPLPPRYLRSQSVMSGLAHDFTDLLALGTDYLIGISNSASGRDVTIIDRRDVNNLVKVSELAIPEVAAFRGRLLGDMLYVTGGSGVAAIDVKNPLAPVKVWSGVTPNGSRGLDLAGNMVALATGGTGVSFFDATSPASTSLLGTQTTGGVAWDLAFSGSSLFVANDQGLVVIDPVAAPPHVTVSSVTVNAMDASTASVSGAPLATSPATTSVRLTNLKTATSVTVAASARGAFSGSIGARAGERLRITARDRSGREETRDVGAVPFAKVTSSESIAPLRAVDVAYLARRVSSDGTATLLTTGTIYGRNLGGSNRALLFRQPDASAPAEIVTLDALPNPVLDEVVAGGYGYVAGPSLAAINLTAAIPTIVSASMNPSGNKGGIAISGRTLFAAQRDSDRNGTIHVYDITTPSAPVYVRSQSVVPWSGFDFRALLPYGSQYLIGISPDRPGGAGHDVVVIDRSDLNVLRLVADLDIAGFDGFAGAIEGSTLYVAGGDAGVAIVDLSNPAIPVWKSTIDTPGLARAVAASRPNEIVVADAGGPGLTFIDTSDRMRPVVLGSQPLDGNATDVKVLGNRVYVATETRFYVLLRP